MEKLIKMALEKAQQAEIYVINEESLPVDFSTNQITRITGKKNQGISLRLIDKKGRIGFATSTKLDRSDLLERALLSAKYGDQSKIKFPNQIGAEVKCYDPKIAQMTADEIVEQGWEMVKIIQKLDPEIKFDLNLTKELEEVTIINSSGLNVNYQRTNFAINLLSRAEDGFREFSDWDIYSQHFKFDQARLKRFVDYHQLSKKKQKVKTGKMDVIFNPGAMWALLYRLATGVDGTMINKGISPLQNRLGEQIFSPLINIVDDPAYPYGFASAPYDDEGSATKRKPLVTRGVLEEYLFNLDAKDQYGEKATPGNGFKKSLFTKGIDTQPSVWPANCLLVPGENTFSEMVKSMERGIIVDQIMGGHTGNIIAGEFGLNIVSGFLVEDGEIKGKVMDAMVSGNIYELFKKVTMVGQELKATRAVFYGFGYSPAILVPQLTIAGSED